MQLADAACQVHRHQQQQRAHHRQHRRERQRQHVGAIDVDARRGRVEQRCHRRPDEGQRHRQQGHRDGEVDDAQRQHQQEVQQRQPGAAIGEHVADALQPGAAAVGVLRPARHALTQQRFHQPPFQQRQPAHRTEEQHGQRYAYDQDHQAQRQRQPGHHPGEEEGARGQRQQHVEQRAIGVRVQHDAEETRHQRTLHWRSGRRDRCHATGLGSGAQHRAGVGTRRAQRAVHRHLGLAIDLGHFLRRAVAAGHVGDHLGLAAARLRGQFRAQVLLGVVQGVLHHRRIGTLQGRAQLRQVLRDRGGQATACQVLLVHCGTPSNTESTESRVACQAWRHCASTSWPRSLMR